MMARKKKLKENVRDEIEEEERDSSDSDSSGFLTHSTFNESKEQRRNRSSASTPAKATSKSPRKSQPVSSKTGGKVLRSPLKEKSRNVPGKVRGRPPTSTPLQRSPGRKKLVGTPKNRRFRPGTRALMEIRYV